jgi:hypothetical protein
MAPSPIIGLGASIGLGEAKPEFEGVKLSEGLDDDDETLGRGGAAGVERNGLIRPISTGISPAERYT